MPALRQRIAIRGLRIDDHRRDREHALQRDDAVSIAGQVEDRIHVGIGAGCRIHRSLGAAVVLGGFEHGARQVAHVLALADLTFIRRHAAVLFDRDEALQVANVAFAVRVRQTDERRGDGFGAECRRRFDNAGDGAAVLALELAHATTLEGERQWAVDVGFGNAAGGFNLGAGLEDAEAHFFDHLRRLLAQQIHRFVENRVFVGVEDDIGDSDQIAVLIQSCRHVFGCELLAGRGDAFGQGRRSGRERRVAAELDDLGVAFRQALGLTELFDHEVGDAALQQFFFSVCRCPGRNIAVDCCHFCFLSGGFG